VRGILQVVMEMSRIISVVVLQAIDNLSQLYCVSVAVKLAGVL
jgi:hypothetical protein